MIDIISFPIRVFLYILENPTTRTFMVLMVILLLFAAIWPGAIYFYPFWNTTITQDESMPFAFGENSFTTRVLHPNRVLPGEHNPYNILVEIENTAEFTSTESVEVQIWEKDPNVAIDGGSTYPLSFKRTFPPNRTSTIIIPIKFSMAPIDSPYEQIEFSMRVISVDGNFASGFTIPIDFYSVPTIALAAALLPVIYFLIKLIVAAWR